MFDRAECVPMGLETIPRVTLAALAALTALLTAARGNGAAAGLASPNTSDSGAGWLSHNENRENAHATPGQRSLPSSEYNPSVRSVRTTGRRQRDAGTGLADVAGSNAPGADEANRSPDPRPHARRSPSGPGRGAP
jgi:hypothetical protein